MLGVFIIFIIVLIAATKSKEKEDESSLNKFYEMLNSRSYGIIYLAQTTCSACESFDKVLEEVKTVGDINYVKINMDKLLNSSANEIVEKLEPDQEAIVEIVFSSEREMIHYALFDEKTLLVAK